MSPELASLWAHWLGPALAGGATFALAAAASVHAIWTKRDVRAAIGWVGLAWLVPVVGAVLYALLGVNRIQRRAGRFRGERLHARAEHDMIVATPTPLPARVPEDHGELASLAAMVHGVTGVPLAEGNAVRALVDGDEAYVVMLEAIERARETVVLATYIFGNDAAGERFIDALGRALARGVQVRVLIDGAGAWYSFPPVVSRLRRRGIPVARFLYSPWPWRMPYMNLRSHRKILVCDGLVGFTGGMNIRAGHQSPALTIHDLHFELRGPVLQHLVQAFAEDWAFTTGESLEQPQWRPSTTPAGPVRARAIVDGPDEDFDKLRWTLLAALTEARRHVRILTPYFLPDTTLIAALKLAVMREVRVDILLPEKSNLPPVGWAVTAQLWQLLESGCRIYLSPPPFDHSKLMLVDDAWALVGSANWDPRSLRLNFELNVECYDSALCADLDRIFEDKLAHAQEVTWDRLSGRSAAAKLRDGIAWLFTPYL